MGGKDSDLAPNRRFFIQYGSRFPTLLRAKKSFSCKEHINGISYGGPLYFSDDGSRSSE